MIAPTNSVGTVLYVKLLLFNHLLPTTNVSVVIPVTVTNSEEGATGVSFANVVVNWDLDTLYIPPSYATSRFTCLDEEPVYVFNCMDATGVLGNRVKRVSPIVGLGEPFQITRFAIPFLGL